MSEIWTLTSMMSIIACTFLMGTHPLFLVILLIMLTFTIMLSIIFLFNCSWLMMILFLIFLGGLLVIFSYLSALVPNEMETPNFIWLILLLNPILYSLYLTNPISQQSLGIEKMNLSGETSSIMVMLFYLLTTLIAAMTFTQNLKNPLHQENN